MTRTGKLFAFLRMHRHELFDDAFQSELEGMYRESGDWSDTERNAMVGFVAGYVVVKVVAGVHAANAATDFNKAHP